jgi:hypothetical protein
LKGKKKEENKESTVDRITRRLAIWALLSGLRFSTKEKYD